MPEEKPIELEGIIEELIQQHAYKFIPEYQSENPSDEFANLLREIIQSTYLLGVKAGKLELIDKIKNSTIESYNGDLVENLPPREAFVIGYNDAINDITKEKLNNYVK